MIFDVMINGITYNFLLPQMKGIIGEFGIVVISRAGHNAEKFVYESDKLFHLKVT